MFFHSCAPQKFLALLLGLMLGSGAWAQEGSPYELSLKTEGAIIGSSILMVGGVWALHNRSAPFEATELAGLDAAQVWAFDRVATRLLDPSAGTRSDAGLLTAAGLGLTSSLLAPAIKKEARPHGGHWLILPLMWWETNTLTYLATDLTKLSFGRTRPFVYQADAPLEDKLELDARKSFFSGHTSLTAANAWFAARVFADYFPDSKWKPAVWGLAIALPAWVGTERVLAGKHFPSDVLAGYAVGAFTGLLVPALHRRASGQIFPGKWAASVEWAAVPGGLCMRW